MLGLVENSFKDEIDDGVGQQSNHQADNPIENSVLSPSNSATIALRSDKTNRTNDDYYYCDNAECAQNGIDGLCDVVGRVLFDARIATIMDLFFMVTSVFAQDSRMKNATIYLVAKPNSSPIMENCVNSRITPIIGRYKLSGLAFLL